MLDLVVMDNIDLQQYPTKYIHTYTMIVGYVGFWGGGFPPFFFFSFFANMSVLMSWYC